MSLRSGLALPVSDPDRTPVQPVWPRPRRRDRPTEWMRTCVMAGPRWVRLDVEYFGNPKIVRLTAPAKLLHLASICWCGAHLTDGHIPTEAVAHLLQATQARRVHVVELVAHHAWYEVDGDYLIHDYTSMQDSREKVERKRRAAAERIAKWRADHDM